MKKTFKLIIRTPEKEIYNGKIESCALTTETGDMVIYADHAELLGNIIYSEIKITHKDHIEDFIVTKGVLHFDTDKNQASIMCFKAYKKDEIDMNAMKDYLKLINQKIEEKELDDLDSYKYQFLEDEKLVLVKTIEKEK